MPTRASSILMTAIWYSTLSLTPGAGSALTVLSSMPVTLPATTASAVATRSGSGTRRMARADEAGWARTTGARPSAAAATRATSGVRFMARVLGTHERQVLYSDDRGGAPD